MKRFLIIALVFLGIGVMAVALGDQTVLADTPKNEVCKAISASPSGGVCDDGSGKTITGVLRSVVNVLSAVAGVLAVIMIIVAGIKYTTSGGDSGKIASAKTTMVYAIVGVVVAALSQALVRAVLNRIVQ